MDLTKDFPRSPRERAGGIAMVPRTIDKARAQLAGTIGEYIYDCSMDRYLFATLGVDAEQFLAAVRQAPDDAGVLKALEPARKPLTEEELKAHNERITHWLPTNEKGWAHFKQDLMKIAPGKVNIKTRTDLIDFEEGRLAGVR